MGCHWLLGIETEAGEVTVWQQYNRADFRLWQHANIHVVLHEFWI